MNLKYTLHTLAVTALIAIAPLAIAAQNTTTEKSPAPQASKQQSFDSPEAAAEALADAARAQDVQALLAVVGPRSKDWLFTGDNVADRADWAKFVAAYDSKHRITQEANNRAVLFVGEDDFPFAAPLKKQGAKWAFDAEAGREEINNRRIGANELNTMQTLLAIVDAQREYAAADPDNSGYNAYARRFISTAGKKDALYWPTPADAEPSPLGLLLAASAKEGYKMTDAKGEPQPYHGYYFRMLTSQGKAAQGGAYYYILNKQLIGGFAVVAYPAKYGVSGVMTFIVNHNGTIYEKDLGPTTQTQATKMTRYNPGKTWKKSE